MKGPGSSQEALLTASQTRRISETVARFDAALEAGRQPVVEKYLKGHDAAERSVLHPELLIREGTQHGSAGEHEKARDCFDRALQLAPQSARPWTAKGGWLLLAQSRPEEALACLDKAVVLDPEDPLAHECRWRALDQLGRSDESLRAFNQWVLVAVVHAPDRVLEIAEGQLSRQPESRFALNGKGLALLQLGRVEEALACFEKLIRIDGTDQGAWTNKIAALHALGRHEEELEASSRLLEMDPTDVHQWVGRARLLSDLGRAEEAQRCIETARAMDPQAGLERPQRQGRPGLTVEQRSVLMILVLPGAALLACEAIWLSKGWSVWLAAAACLLALIRIFSVLAPYPVARLAWTHRALSLTLSAAMGLGSIAWLTFPFLVLSREQFSTLYFGIWLLGIIAKWTPLWLSGILFEEARELEDSGDTSGAARLLLFAEGMCDRLAGQFVFPTGVSGEPPLRGEPKGGLAGGTAALDVMDRAANLRERGLRLRRRGKPQVQCHNEGGGDRPAPSRP